LRIRACGEKQKGNTMTKQSKSWRDVIEVHPAANLFPLMTPDELNVLAEDIKKNGLKTPVTLLKQGSDRHLLLDGRNRLDAMEAGGVQILARKGKFGHRWLRRPTEVKGVDPYAYVISANLHRRHFTGEQKRQLIATVLKAQPSKSNRQVAKTVGVSHPHVAVVRAELEKSGDVETVTTSIDTKGRAQPARKPINKRRDIENHIEKRMNFAPTIDADSPRLAPQQTDIANCIVEPASAVQRILEAIEKLSDQQLAELKAALMRHWSDGLGVLGKNVGPH
jgi:hypothetical protein